MSGALVDWSLASRTAAAIAGRAGASYGAEEVRAACRESIGAASRYADLPVPAEPPVPEVIDRRGWADNALETLALAAEPLERRLAGELSMPGPLGGVARRVVGGGAGIEAGVAVGYAARRVLGQYDVAIFGPERPGTLLFVGENMESARAELGADRSLFLRWIALHETTHVLQLDGVPWLVPHLRSLASQLISETADGIDTRGVRALIGRAVRNPREVVASLLRGELLDAITSPDHRALLDRLQAAMSVIEGHAEHVMDVCAEELDPGLGELRDRLEARRDQRGGLSDVVARLLGLELKLRQYRLGKQFCDAVADAAGADGLAALWRSPEALPDLDELEDPGAWLARVGVASATR
ncbi:MAG: zinc-dependent metalloprotease [Solirubrobacterales bacterium]